MKHDASTPEAKPEVASSPEAGPETAGLPNSPEACAMATNVGVCDPGIPSATIKHAPGAPLLAAVAVTSGACQANTCTSGCESIGVYTQSATIGATCDLRVTAIDGQTQSIQLTVVANPSPMYACCGSPQALSPTQWVPLNPAIFSPTLVVVDFTTPRLDGGTSPMDSGIDRSAFRDTAGTPDVYSTPMNEQSCLAATGVSACDPGVPSATVRSATGSTLLTKVEITRGACAGADCFACNTLAVYGSASQSAGATCDLLITTSDGGKQAARIAVIRNPSPVYTCCGYPLPPNPGRWTATDPLVFSPSTVLVTAALDGGMPPIIDSGVPHDVPFSE